MKKIELEKTGVSELETNQLLNIGGGIGYYNGFGNEASHGGRALISFSKRVYHFLGDTWEGFAVGFKDAFR